MAEFEPALKKRLEELWGMPPNLYRGLANHPAIIAAWTEFANTLRHGSRTPRPLRELVILRGARLSKSEYEWAQHLKMARQAGVREAQIQELASWKTSSSFSSQEKAVLSLAEEVTAGKVSDATQAEVLRHFDMQDFVDLSITAAFYARVGRMLDAMAVQLEPDARDYSPKLPG
jgi:alkylhydroperoxidase family enzyme